MLRAKLQRQLYGDTPRLRGDVVLASGEPESRDMLRAVEYAPSIGVFAAPSFEFEMIELSVKDADDFFKKRQVRVKQVRVKNHGQPPNGLKLSGERRGAILLNMITSLTEV